MAENNEPNDDAAAAEWEAALAAEDGAKQDASAAESAGDAEQRILNQDEIDTLLGFDTKQDRGSENDNGIFAIMDKSMTAYEKLPMLEVVFDRMVRQLATSLRNFTSENVDVALDSMVSLRFEDYLNSIPLPALLVVFRAVEWENFGLVTVDSSQIYSMVDILLGGRKSHKTMRVEGRPYTTIEQDIVKRMIDIVLAEMSSAFEPLSPATFLSERLESNPRFVTITRPGNPVLLIRLRVDMLDDRGGIIEILFPHATLEPIHELLLQMFMGENFGQDTVWEKHLGKELRATNVEIEAIFDQKMVTLGDIMRLQVGSTLLLDCKPEEPITLRCGGIPVTTGSLGRVENKVAISVHDAIKRKPREVTL